MKPAARAVTLMTLPDRCRIMYGADPWPPRAVHQRGPLVHVDEPRPRVHLVRSRDLLSRVARDVAATGPGRQPALPDHEPRASACGRELTREARVRGHAALPALPNAGQPSPPRAPAPGCARAHSASRCGHRAAMP